MTKPLWVIIPSAGKGKRFGSQTPKQHQTLLGATVLQHTLSRFTERDDVTGIVLAVSADDQLVASLEPHAKVHIVHGGLERSDSVLNALEYLHGLAGDDDLIAVHDAARPCIRKSSLDQLFELSQQAQAGAILALPVTDTVKLVSLHDRLIERTIDRNQIWLAQTPQVFPYKLLVSALRGAKREEKTVTDEASAIELIGLQPLVVPGRKDNIKITTSEDLALAALLMKNITEDHD